MRYLAIDYGQKHTGLAICDAGEMIASPLAVLTAGQGGLIPKITDVIDRENVEAIVLGLPLNMDGTAGAQAKRVRSFAEQMRRHIDIPIHFHDERLSSFDAEKKLAGLGLTRKKKKKHLDAVAAASILQSFLDKKLNR
jgi:putative Holliday junction resolvase